MENKLYDLLDWAEVEEIVYSESNDPHRILGAHRWEGGYIVKAFIPTAKQMHLVIDGNKKKTEMERVDEKGFFACLLERKTPFKYSFQVVFDDDSEMVIRDPYSFAPLYSEEDLERFGRGVHYDIYEKMGAHPVTVDKVDGVYFSVWAPAAIRVSVVGNFNLWDGRRHPMRRLGDSGVFELFIPHLSPGEIYKYEVKTRKGEPMLKADPYGFFTEIRPNNASIVCDLSGFSWTDAEFLKERKVRYLEEKAGREQPMNIYEVHLGSWQRKHLILDEEGREIYGSEFFSYRELAPLLLAYVKKMGYTHIELMPIMEHPLDESWGYQVTGYYAPTSRYGTPQDFMYFVDYFHAGGIGVILDWVPAHFPKDLHGLAAFDGSHVYEHADPRQGMHPHWGTLIYNYGRPQVSNFLIANALYWAKYYHIDGIRMDAVASMLYLDYGKNDGEWVANIYGGHENLEAIEFLKHLNSIVKQQHPDVLLIAEESTAWPKISGSLDEEGLGFDYKWNMGWMNDFLRFMKYDPYFRSYHYGEVTFSMIYQYSEKFILVLSHDEVVHGKGSLANKMPGENQEEKCSNLRAAYGFMMMHPGKKLLFMGQELAQFDEWNEHRSVEWELLDYPVHQNMQNYVRELNGFYNEHKALWQQDGQEHGFEWINCRSYKETILAFMRRGVDPSDDLLVVCNFTPVLYENVLVGVPYKGKFKEIFNSDDVRFGGGGAGNPRVKTSGAKEADGRPYSVSITIPPLSTIVFRMEEIKTGNTDKKKPRKTAAKEKAAKERVAEDKALKKTSPRKTAKRSNV